MSDYKTLRLKKNTDLLNAISNVRKDLYAWKPNNNNSNNNNIFKLNKAKPSSPNPNPKQRLKSLDPPFGHFLNRSSSLKDLSSRSNGSFNTSTRLASKTITQFKKSNDFSDDFLIDLDDLDSNNLPGPNNHTDNDLSRTSKSDLGDEKFYLNSARFGFAHRLRTTQKTKDEIEKELSEKMNQMNPQLIFELDLSQCDLKTTKNLEKFTGLKILDLSCNQINKLENLNFKNLIELRLFVNQIESIENLENLPELQSLQLQANRIKKLNKGLCSLKKLEYLRLDQNQLECISNGEMASCVNLIYLNISHNKISSFMFINVLPNLEELDASFLCLSRLDDIDSNRCRKLTEIDLSHNQLVDENLIPLVNCYNLTSLKISHNNLRSIKTLSNIKSLKNVDASTNQIENINELKNLKDLETLDISNNKIKDWNQIESLVHCRELIEIQLENNPVLVKKTIDDIQVALPNLKYINDTKVENSNKIIKQVNKKNVDMEIPLLQIDIKNFENEMEIFNQSFLKRLNDIRDNLSSLIPKEETTTTTNESTIISTERSTSAKKSSKLFDALYYSKQLGDSKEPECNTS